MKTPDDEQLSRFLRNLVPPFADLQSERDLWPGMLLKFDKQGRNVPWLDWVLAGMLPIWILLFPEVAAVLLYHL